MDGSIPEVLVDNDDKQNVQIEGNWQRKTSEEKQGYTGNYGPGMLVSEKSSEKQSVKFIPLIKTRGTYNLYAYFPKIPQSTTSTHFIVFDGKSSKDVVINNSAVQVEGQTSGEWVSLGTYVLPEGNHSFVTVTNKGADGTIVADAVLFVPMKK